MKAMKELVGYGLIQKETKYKEGNKEPLGNIYILAHCDKWNLEYSDSPNQRTCKGKTDRKRKNNDAPLASGGGSAPLASPSAPLASGGGSAPLASPSAPLAPKGIPQEGIPLIKDPPLPPKGGNAEGLIFGSEKPETQKTKGQPSQEVVVPQDRKSTRLNSSH